MGIVGGYGFLGYKIATFARKIGLEITIADLKKYETKDSFDFSRIDITNSNDVDEFFAKHELDVVVLTAAQSNVDLCEREESLALSVNAIGPLNIARACKKKGSKLVFLSTDFVFDGKKGDYREEDIPNPISVYGKSKLVGEENVLRTLPEALICRTSVLYGVKEPFQHENYVQWIISELTKKSNISITRDQFNSPTLIDDLADIIIKLIQKNKHGIWHTAGSQCMNRYDFAIKIAHAFGLDASLIKPVDTIQQLAQRPKKACLNISKLRKEMGIVPLSVDEGIKYVIGSKI